ncbi:carbon-nitrogen hydrolase family protein [Methylonatrum kenyense]|uniref:carbon-nitrogen hydrolase family protein n=1 Tax=Methylonatrum kenyense TaxID=455253 RepID=UPI0020BF9E60|nr:carbon-nitrogen hydrolase family protein [Methylonatrum kenyense]MCK8516248.1 carbon-nitrogen hydrolase family protein [Methylonatrum kenyense]
MHSNPSRPGRLAAIQMASGGRVAANVAEIRKLVARAAAGGADLVLLPENAFLMGRSEADKLAIREPDSGGPIQACLAELAASHGLWLVAGSIPMVGDDPGRARQSCLVFDDRGQRVARYDKVHLFDVQVSVDEAYRESATLEPGDRAVVVETPFGRLGLSICYDLRFPEFYRAMVERGAELLVVPSAFTARTGEAHWRPLLRARAIENLCYVIAANQGGFHLNGRRTHGESMIVDPWGRILDVLEHGSGVVFGDFDPDSLRDIRRRFPALAHRRSVPVDEVMTAPASVAVPLSTDNQS